MSISSKIAGNPKQQRARDARAPSRLDAQGIEGGVPDLRRGHERATADGGAASQDDGSEGEAREEHEGQGGGGQEEGRADTRPHEQGERRLNRSNIYREVQQDFTP